MRIDEAGDERPAGGIDDAACRRLIGRRPLAGRGLNLRDDAAAHDDGGARRDAPVAVNDAGVADDEIGRSLGHGGSRREHGAREGRQQPGHERWQIYAWFAR